MIQNYVPRKFGLEEVISDILSSDAPLLALAKKGGFVDSNFLTVMGHRFKDAEKLMTHIRTSDSGGHAPNLRIALDYLAGGQDYLDIDEGALREAFPNGEQEYYFVDVEANAYNPSFKLVVFPKETIATSDTRKVLEDFSYPPHYNPGKYELVKTLVLTDGSGYYMFSIKGDERLDLKKASRMLYAERERVRFVPPGDIKRLIGREVGAVSPLFQLSCFGNIQRIFVSKELLQNGYSQPHYNLVIDRRSALLVSDMQDVFDTLSRLGCPPVYGFHNDRLSAN